MSLKNSFVQGVVLVLLSAVLALVSNAVAGRERKLVLPGYYPNAMKVPPRAPELPSTSTTAPPAALTATVAPTATSVPAVTTTTAMSPAPGNPPIPIPTATVERPAGQAPKTAPAPPAVAARPAIVPNPEVVNADPMKRFPPHPDKAYVEIGFDDAAWLRSKGALVIDARRTSVYDQGHIAGSRSFPVWESDIDERVNKLFEERSDPQAQLQPIVIYCSGGDCEDSHMLAQKLWGIQFNNVYVYKDGFPDWQKRGGAVHTGSNP